MRWYLWPRIAFNVLLGREDPLDRPKEQEKKVEVAREVMTTRPPVRRDLTTRPIRLYGTTRRGKKVHIRRINSLKPSYLCGAEPDQALFSSVPPVEAFKLCSTCLSLAEKEEQ